jgi:hypothetical protein
MVSKILSSLAPPKTLEISDVHDSHFNGNTSPNVADGATCHDPALFLNKAAPEILA